MALNWDGKGRRCNDSERQQGCRRFLGLSRGEGGVDVDVDVQVWVLSVVIVVVIVMGDGRVAVARLDVWAWVRAEVDPAGSCREIYTLDVGRRAVD